MRHCKPVAAAPPQGAHEVRKDSVSMYGPVAQALYNRAIGIDVHHSLLVCAFQYANLQTQTIETQTCSFGTTASELARFTQWCRERNPEKILMESTGVLWFSPYEALEQVGFTAQELILVNARDLRSPPGRKTDTSDARNLAVHARMGTVKGSFVPAKRFREMRIVARHYSKTKGDISRAKSRYQKVLNYIGLRASSVFSDPHGKAATAILTAYCEGEENMLEVIEKHGKRLRKTPEQILDALNFAMTQEMRAELEILRFQLDQLNSVAEQQLALLTKMQSTQRDRQMIAQLQELPAVNELAARLLYAEITDNLSSFPDADHLASWAGLCPGNNESAGKRYSGRAPKGNKYVRSILTECSHAIGFMKYGSMKDVFQAFKERRGHRRAVIAVAHRLLKLIYAIVALGKPYVDKPTDALEAVRKRSYQKSVRNIKELNYEILQHGVLVNKDTGAITAVDPAV